LLDELVKGKSYGHGEGRHSSSKKRGKTARNNQRLDPVHSRVSLARFHDSVSLRGGLIRLKKLPITRKRKTMLRREKCRNRNRDDEERTILEVNVGNLQLWKGWPVLSEK